MGRGDPPQGSQPFDVTLPEGFDLEAHRPALETAAKDAGWTIELDGAIVIVRDVWTENEDHAAWLVDHEGGVVARTRHRLGRARSVTALKAVHPQERP